jgi:hypothetical protein
LEDLPNASCVGLARRRAWNREPGSSNKLLVSNPGLGGLARRLACEAQEVQHGALQPHHVGGIEAAQPAADGTVVSLSTIRLEAFARPLPSVGLTGRRTSGAAVGSVVKAQSVTDLVASNKSD